MSASLVGVEAGAGAPGAVLGGMPPRNADVALALGRGRRRSDRIVKVLCWTATAIGLLFLASILYTLFVRGLGGLHWSVLTEVTKPAGSNGGCPWINPCMAREFCKRPISLAPAITSAISRSVDR